MEVLGLEVGPGPKLLLDFPHCLKRKKDLEQVLGMGEKNL
jgi:hypothetical protein